MNFSFNKISGLEKKVFLYNPEEIIKLNLNGRNTSFSFSKPQIVDFENNEILFSIITSNNGVQFLYVLGIYAGIDKTIIGTFYFYNPIPKEDRDYISKYLKETYGMEVIFP